MKFYIIAFAVLLVVLGGAAVVFSEPSVVVPMTSGSDDASMKSLSIN